MWAFPGLDKKLAKRVLPAAHSAVTDDQVDEVAAAANKAVITGDEVVVDMANGKDAGSGPGAGNMSPMHGVSNPRN